ncbi:MAG: response regulator, partial [Deltaproteobacteria bacterium]|nr:response regulator [Deltaproteobacteria bacterium]
MQSASVEGGPQGLAALRTAVDHNEPYDLALLDYYMPEMNGLDLAQAIVADPSLAPLKLVMLSSLGQRSDAKAADYTRIAAWLTKPVRQSQLFDCLATTFSQALPKDRPQRTPRLAPPLREETALQHRPLVLIAEDNAVNQKLAVHMLAKLGYRADVVADGREALEALSHIPYSAVLMDCQMPELDGFEATREIRARENITGTHLPIIAMTANAMRGDRERCLEAGMDDYLPKPVRPEDLKAVLAHWTGFAGSASVISPPPPPPASPAVSVFNLEETLKRVEGDRTLLGEMVTLFLQDSATLLTNLRAALVNQDTKALVYAAHTLKGSVGNFSAPEVFNAAANLEKLARTGDLSQAPAVLLTLEHELARLQSALTPLSTELTT